jgi:hypothetical protein
VLIEPCRGGSQSAIHQMEEGLAALRLRLDDVATEQIWTGTPVSGIDTLGEALNQFGYALAELAQKSTHH